MFGKGYLIISALGIVYRFFVLFLFYYYFAKVRFLKIKEKEKVVGGLFFLKEMILVH